ncbi:MAG TPA: hypothetical protein VIG06_31545 [Kofleriaceae bacterium]
MTPEPTPRRAIRIVSQCATKEDFIAVFHPYLERDALFVATASPEEAGARLHFVMTLAGGEAVLRGAGVVVESHRSKSNFYGRRGMKLRFDELDGASQKALRAVEAGPRRHSSAPPVPGRGPNEMVECLIYEDPGTEPREPLGSGASDVAEPSDPGNLPALTSDDDVTAVAELPRRPGESGDGDRSGAQADASESGDRMAGFVVPRPRSDPSIAINPAGERVSMASMAQLDTEQMRGLPPAHVEQAPPLPADPVPSPPRLPFADEQAVRARRGKGTGPSPVAEAPAAAAAIAPAEPPPSDVAALTTMRLPAAEARRSTSPPPPGRFRHESSPPEYVGGEFTPPPGMGRQPGAPRHPMVPQATITPTEIVSPLALDIRAGEGRRPRAPMPSERTDVVRVSTVRAAAVSATLGALLGLAAGYLLWGLEQESEPALVVPDRDQPSTEPMPRVPNEAPVEQLPAAALADAGPGTAAPAADAAAAPAATPRPPAGRAIPPRPGAPLKKPPPRRRPHR